MLSVTIDSKSVRKAHFDSFAETCFESMTFASILRQIDDGNGNLDGTKNIMGSIRSAIYDHDDVSDIACRAEDDIPERRGIVICGYYCTDHNIVTCEKRIVVSSPLASWITTRSAMSVCGLSSISICRKRRCSSRFLGVRTTE